MDLLRYWRIARRRAWMPLVLVIATTATVGFLTFRSQPGYVADATVQARVVTGTGVPAATQTLSLQEVVASNTLALAVVRELNLDQSAADLSQRLNVVAGHSDLYTISVKDRNPDQAVAIANSVANNAVRIYQSTNAVADTTVFDQTVAAKRLVFLQRFDDAERALLQFQADHPDLTHQTSDIALQTRYQELLLDQQAAAAAYSSFVASSTTSVVNALSEATHFSASVLDPAVARPDIGSRYLKIGAAAALALVLGVGLVVLFEAMDTNMREPENVEDLTGLPVVGIIPQATSRSLKPVRGSS